MRRSILLAAVVLAGCGDQPTEPAQPDGLSAAVTAAGSWIRRADFPLIRWDAASATVTNAVTGRSTLYVMGGQWIENGGAVSISSALRAFDVSANTWASKASMPKRIMGSNGAVEINGKVYISGGFTRRWDEKAQVYRLDVLKSLFLYNPATDTWTPKKDMPITTARGWSAVYQGMLYVATSCYDTAYCGETHEQGALWRYNPATDNWVLLSRTPHNPGYGGGGFVGQKLYFVAELGSVDVYDVLTKAWTTGPQRPIRLCSPASATLQAKLYLVGCHDDLDGSGAYPMLVLDPKLGTWSQAAVPPIAANGHLWTLTRVVVNGQPRLELVGGAKPNNYQFIP
jgi:hypothetical protein